MLNFCLSLFSRYQSSNERAEVEKGDAKDKVGLINVKKLIFKVWRDRSHIRKITQDGYFRFSSLLEQTRG